MKRKVVDTILTMALAVSLTACGSSSSKETTSNEISNETTAESTEDTPEETAKSSDYEITMILKATAAEYWQYMIAGAQAAGKDLGVKVNVIGPTSESEIAQ